MWVDCWLVGSARLLVGSGFDGGVVAGVAPGDEAAVEPRMGGVGV